METTARFYLCARCRCQVLICSHCDRGQRYCGQVCSQTARTESLQAAGQRYQTSRQGRHHHAERQRRYRQRQREKVTHQGSPLLRGNGSLFGEPYRRAQSPVRRSRTALETVICHFCGRICELFVRLGFIKRRRRARRSVTLAT